MGTIGFGLSDLLYLPKRETPCTLVRVDGEASVPGQAWVQLEPAEFLPYLKKTQLTIELDKLTPYLWLVRSLFKHFVRFITTLMNKIATPNAGHVSPLHHQETRGRKIIVTEYPGLHAIWYYDRIFIKPIPPYMLCQAFWQYIKEEDEEVWKASAGFMRTYCYLIQYEVDFYRAVSSDLRLIPQPHEAPQLTYERFVRFIAQFEHLKDHHVSPRYRYGSIRLSRLNILAFCPGKPPYLHIRPQWRDFFAHLFAPMITLFAILSVVLSSIQVGLAAQSLDNKTVWEPFVSASGWVAALFLIVALIVSFVVVVMPMLLFVKDIYFGLKMMRLLKKDNPRARSMSSAVVG